MSGASKQPRTSVQGLEELRRYKQQLRQKFQLLGGRHLAAGTQAGFAAPVAEQLNGRARPRREASRLVKGGRLGGQEGARGRVVS